jgi:cytochrome c-type biogenesis protein CcmH
MRAKRACLVLVCVLSATSGWTIDEQPGFEEPALNERYQSLIREVRCLVCQNQTIADSNAPLAADLRREIHQRMADGETDGEIVDFLVARYGDFVMYRPLIKPETWALWAGPFVFLAIGALVFWRVLKTRRAQPLDEDPTP